MSVRDLIPWGRGNAQQVPGVFHDSARDPFLSLHREVNRLFDDVWGAQNASLRAVHILLSVIPASQVGHTEGTPDAVILGLAELPDVLTQWRA